MIFDHLCSSQPPSRSVWRRRKRPRGSCRRRWSSSRSGGSGWRTRSNTRPRPPRLQSRCTPTITITTTPRTVQPLFVCFTAPFVLSLCSAFFFYQTIFLINFGLFVERLSDSLTSSLWVPSVHKFLIWIGFFYLTHLSLVYINKHLMSMIFFFLPFSL